MAPPTAPTAAPRAAPLTPPPCCGGGARRASHRAALLWRRCRGRLRRLGGVEAGLLLGPVVAVELVLLKGLLALPRLGRHEQFGLTHAREHPRGKSGDDRPTILHVYPPTQDAESPRERYDGSELRVDDSVELVV